MSEAAATAPRTSERSPLRDGVRAASTPGRQIRHALAEALGVTDDAPPADKVPVTVDVDGAAKLLRCSSRAVYVRRQRGQLPRPISARPLLWRTADLLAYRK